VINKERIKSTNKDRYNVSFKIKAKEDIILLTRRLKTTLLLPRPTDRVTSIGVNSRITRLDHLITQLDIRIESLLGVALYYKQLIKKWQCYTDSYNNKNNYYYINYANNYFAISGL